MDEGCPLPFMEKSSTIGCKGKRMGKVANRYSDKAEAVINNGSCYDFVKTVPDKSVALVVTSPPYNIGKRYEKNQV
ncbi:MAG: hypothetical protein LBG43_11020 [Treponema sp.]|jgi:hypothetical protein|nr:hypothetical protein [Treponema sp.]